MKIAIITAPFYRHINDGLYQGAVNYLNRENIEHQRFDVPGALEVPLACQYLVQTNHFDAIVALGAVIRGETAHFDHVCEQSSRGIMNVSLQHNIPIGNGIITVENEKQALARSSVDESMGKENKGKEAAQAAVALLRMRKEIFQ
ncbi:6,7-dimethyl-8-ribityllumazine synthase [Marinicella sp. S1101]|uniref:6,7-dimethyl-8-ribityllumazine synthase n=1 Tax=Marinicella marina TaxID=2996016 RepID=UPI00226090AC|nr:6,7-dimethyl-8-ribityllumazine synthase [Marinicella marina]MCX7554896.1 6,7-dimethyl-8-ribityllumazine synthase [Marinicella marina]MDJ1141280.1 6,7-dimethyl-8-ribityllumazine synthase [Marinicella marina]